MRTTQPTTRHDARARVAHDATHTYTPQQSHARRGEDRTRAILVLAQRFMLDTAGTPYRLRIQLMTHSV